MAIVTKTGLHGRVSNIVYRSYRGMQIAQIKPAKVKQTLASKEAGLEFGLAASTAACIRKVFGTIYQGKDGGMANRLTALTVKSIKTAHHKRRGERDIHDGDAGMFAGFEFHMNSPLQTALQVRPEVSISEEGLMKVKVPAFTAKELRAPEANYYVIRFLAVSFNFRTSVARYVSTKEIRIENLKGYEGGEIEVLDMNTVQEGRLVLLSMSVHAYKKDTYDGYRCINSKEWSPAAIIGGWQLPAGEEIKPAETAAEHNRACVEERASGFRYYPMTEYVGMDIRSKFRDLWLKYEKKGQLPQVPKLPEPNISTGSDLPEGDFKI